LDYVQGSPNCVGDVDMKLDLGNMFGKPKRIRHKTGFAFVTQSGRKLMTEESGSSKHWNAQWRGVSLLEGPETELSVVGYKRGGECGHADLLPFEMYV
jgi:hypothetical protein